MDGIKLYARIKLRAQLNVFYSLDAKKKFEIDFFCVFLSLTLKSSSLLNCCCTDFSDVL